MADSGLCEQKVTEKLSIILQISLISEIETYKLLYADYTYLYIRKNFFADRVINVWSSLSPVVDFSSLACFKRTIKT